MILHTVNQSPFTHHTLMSCIERLGENDSLILLENGVLSALTSQPYAKHLATVKRCYAIRDDVLARGLQDTVSNVQLVDYAKFVSLSCEHLAVKSWY